MTSKKMTGCPETPTNTRSPLELFFPYAAISALAVTVYANTAGYTFVFDDLSGILNAHIIASATSLSQAVRLLSEPWRALTQLSYALTIKSSGRSRNPVGRFHRILRSGASLLAYGIYIEIGFGRGNDTKANANGCRIRGRTDR
jgi:hypothetical protein